MHLESHALEVKVCPFVQQHAWERKSDQTCLLTLRWQYCVAQRVSYHALEKAMRRERERDAGPILADSWPRQLQFIASSVWCLIYPSHPTLLQGKKTVGRIWELTFPGANLLLDSAHA